MPDIFFNEVTKETRTIANSNRETDCFNVSNEVFVCIFKCVLLPECGLLANQQPCVSALYDLPFEP